MNTDKISALISLAVAITILIANFFQWWDITFNGHMITRKWVKFIFLISIILLLISALFIIV